METKSILKDFTTQYVINGIDGYDYDSFMDVAKETVSNLLKKNYETKVKLILECKMERTDIETGVITEILGAFHFAVEINLESANRVIF